MDTKRKLIGTAAIVAGVGLGTIAGAMFGAPTVSGAAEGTVAVAEHGGHRGPGPRLQAAAEAIGISEDDLRAALEDGQTIAEVAAANGVEVQAVVDAMVNAAVEAIQDSERAEELRARLVERTTAIVNGERPVGRHGGPCDDEAPDTPDATGGS